MARKLIQAQRKVVEGESAKLLRKVGRIIRLYVNDGEKWDRMNGVRFKLLARYQRLFYLLCDH